MQKSAEMDEINARFLSFKRVFTLNYVPYKWKMFLHMDIKSLNQIILLKFL